MRLFLVAVLVCLALLAWFCACVCIFVCSAGGSEEQGSADLSGQVPCQLDQDGGEPSFSNLVKCSEGVAVCCRCCRMQL